MDAIVEAVGKPLELKSARLQQRFNLLKLFGGDNQVEVKADQRVYVGVDPLPINHAVENLMLLEASACSRCSSKP